MADKDMTNRQLLAALTEQLGVITDNMVTKEELQEGLKALREELHSDFDNLELRLGRRIDAALLAKSTR